MHIYPVNTPDRIEPGTVAATQVIYPSTDYPTVRLGQTVLGEDNLGDGIIVTRIAFGEPTHLTPSTTDTAGVLPQPADNTWYIVSTPVALASPHRTDLLVPYGFIRDLDGNVLGSRGFARPYRGRKAKDALDALRARRDLASCRTQLFAVAVTYLACLEDENAARGFLLETLIYRLLELATPSPEVRT
jgi:hypothetical protein